MNYSSYCLCFAKQFLLTSKPKTYIFTEADIAPSFLTGPEDIEIMEGKTATFTAEVSGKPEPTMEW